MQLIDEFLRRTPTTTLFHYTSARGLIGILESGSIYASSAYHQNDSTEFHYAIGLIVEQLEVRLAFEHGSWKSLYERLINQLPSISKSAQVFVSSFSEEGDLLSQWMAYSGSANGFAIGLSPSHFDLSRNLGFALVKCVYDQKSQGELANAVVDAICQSNGEPDVEVMNKILITAAAIKHPGFVQEAEWRLIKPLALSAYGSGGIQFREGRLGMVPYLDAPLVLNDGKLVPASIHVGPNGDASAVEASVDTLLYARGLNELRAKPRVEVVPSNTPYRP